MGKDPGFPKKSSPRFCGLDAAQRSPIVDNFYPDLALSFNFNIDTIRPEIQYYSLEQYSLCY
jgi:hypothetical protein